MVAARIPSRARLQVRRGWPLRYKRNVTSQGKIVERTMPPHASSVRRARALMRETLTGAADSLVDDAELAVSEVVTNALVHAGTEVHVQARLDGERLRV